MRFTFAAAALLAFVSSALAQDANPDFNVVRKPEKDEKVQAGSTYEVKWDVPPKFADVKISIQLVGGQSQNKQQVLGTVATGVANSAGKYDWAVDATLEDLPVYGLKFISEANAADYQWSNPFRIVGGAAGNTTTVTSTGSPTVTVSLSSVSSAEVTTTAPPTHANTTAAPGRTTITSVVTPGGGSTTRLSTSSLPAAGAQATAGAFAVLGGLAMAVMAL